ncbi:MAG: methionyl-tRNA formyltransferase [Acidimicrobiales bacterium]
MARLAFLGSPAVAAECLEALHRAGHDIRVVITGADKRRGRGGELAPTPVKGLAVHLGLTTSEQVSDVVHSGAELGVVVAFGRLIKPEILAEVPMVNAHFSLLPRWRGAAPVEWAILEGDEKTGVCLMRVEAGLDAGGVYSWVETDISPDETADELRSRLASTAAELLVTRLEHGAKGLGEPIVQQGEPTYATKLSVEDFRLDFDLPAVRLGKLVRLGRAWTMWRSGRLLVHRARVDCSPTGGTEPGRIVGERVATAEGWFVPIEVQAEGRRRQPFAEWLRGARVVPTDRLGSDYGQASGDTVA